MDSKRIAAARCRVYILVTTIAALPGTASATGLMPQYTAAEARKHIGETATVVGKVGCVDAGRTFHCLPLDGCLGNSPFWIIVNDDASGPELNVNELKGVTIAVSGKIERPQTQPWLVVKSTTQIVPRTKLNPDYLGRARQKESQGDLDGAIAEFDHAIELNHESTAYIERAEVHMNKGDLDGAISDYDQLIERYPEGVYYLKRAGLKMKKSDYADVIADSSRAIELLARHYASHPNDHSTFTLAEAYSERGEAKEAMGDAAGAIPDYENAVKNDRAQIYKEKLRTAKAEAAAKKVAITRSTAQAAQNEQSSNKDKDEVSPESIAEAFVQAYSGTNVDAVAGLYGDRVDYTNSGVISNAAIRKQAREYFERWPERHWSLVGPVKELSLGTSKKKVVFSASYDASNPQSNKHASGMATETLILITDANGDRKIVSQKEQTSKRSSSGSDEETSDAPGLRAAKAEYDSSSHDEAARVRYVTKLAAILGEGMEYWWRTHDRMGGPNVGGVEEELRKHPMPRNADSKMLSKLLIGEWGSSRHVYAFRADGTYGVSDEERDKWRIDKNEYVDDVSRGPIILLNRNYFIYAEGQGVAFYMRVKDSNAERNESADIDTLGNEKLTSPYGNYSIEVVRGTEDSLVLSHGGEVIARVPTSVGPVGSFFEALWSPDGKYVAINKQRSSRPGGDEMWIVALPSGKVLRQPDDALLDELYEKADAFITEKGLNETGGKEFLTLTASGWEKDRLRCRLEAGFSEIEDRYFFEGTVDPLHLKTIADWKVSKTKS
jgi:tetratricopeptide (TPR) repeat protein